MDARGKFGEHESSVRVARRVAESNSSTRMLFHLTCTRHRMTHGRAYVEKCTMMMPIGIRLESTRAML